MTTDQPILSDPPIHVLLVDDELTFAKAVNHFLQKFPNREFNLIWKDSVEAGIQEVANNKTIDIIITDYVFAESNGLEFCLQLNQMNTEIPIIFLTATKDFKLAIDAMKLGVEDFLLKEDLSESLLPRTIINVHERVQMRRQSHAIEKRMIIAEKRAEAIRELVVTVCHEFNNPLAAIKISTDLLRRQPMSEKEAQVFKTFDENFQQIESEIKRLRDINFEKIDFRNQKID
ncbi:MAG: response regulator [bacterium]